MIVRHDKKESRAHIIVQSTILTGPVSSQTGIENFRIQYICTVSEYKIFARKIVHDNWKITPLFVFRFCGLPPSRPENNLKPPAKQTAFLS